MNVDKPKILVPYDYTEKSDFAVKYAVQLAKIIEGDIVMLHIIASNEQESTELKKLQDTAKTTIDKYGVTIDCLVKDGVIRKVIKDVAVSIEAFVVIMKTQPPKGKEKFLQSRSIKVMMDSKVPFIVVQDEPKRLAIRNIVFPIDFRRENKEKLIWISILSKYYTSKIHLFKPHANDYRVRNNLDFAKRFLEGKRMAYEIISGKRRLIEAEEVCEYANKVDAQLIIIMLNKNITWLNSIFGLSEQKFIANKFKIPVMVINPKAELHKYEGFN